MHAGVDFGMPARRLRNTIERRNLREDLRQRAAVSEGLEIEVRPGLPQRTLGLLPDALRHQGIDLTRVCHTAHQCQSFIGHPKPKIRVSGSKTSHSQNAHRIFHERLGDVPQESRLQIAAATIWVDDLSGGSLRHSVDGKVAAPKILLQRDIRSELRGEASVTETHFALGASESVFLMGLRMQKDREFATDGLEPVALELFGARADDDPVTLVHRTPEQTVPNRTANQVNFHTSYFTLRGAMRCAEFAGTGLRLLFLATLLATVSGCYVMQAATGQLRVMSSRKPIDKVLADPNTPRSLRDTLQEVEAARNFASQELGLPDNRSYRTYADVHRPYVVWNVV